MTGDLMEYLVHLLCFVILHFAIFLCFSVALFQQVHGLRMKACRRLNWKQITDLVWKRDEGIR